MNARPAFTPAAPAVPAPRASALSLVLVVEADAPEASRLAAVGARIAEAFEDSEIILVANGCPPATAARLRALAGEVPDLTVHFLIDRLDRDGALLAGIANAIGDHVLAIEDAALFDRAFAAATRALDDDMEIALLFPERTRPPAFWERAFVWTFNLFTGDAVHSLRPVGWLYARDAARHLLQSPAAELLLRSPGLASGFATRKETLAGTPPPRRKRSLRETAAKAMRLMIGSSAAPLRIITAFALAGAGLALGYSAYAVAVYLLEPNVEPGWTTLSLILSFMLFMTSVMFALLAEYIVLIQRGFGGHRRIGVAREVRSPLSRRHGRLNVVADGGFALGAPADEARDG